MSCPVKVPRYRGQRAAAEPEFGSGAVAMRYEPR
jgi:hypothetical protein